MEYKEHPALLAWFTFDEPRNPPFIAELKRTYEKLQEWDPAHPVIGNNNTAAEDTTAVEPVEQVAEETEVMDSTAVEAVAEEVATEAVAQ